MKNKSLSFLYAIGVEKRRAIGKRLRGTKIKGKCGMKNVREEMKGSLEERLRGDGCERGEPERGEMSDRAGI